MPPQNLHFFDEQFLTHLPFYLATILALIGILGVICAFAAHVQIGHEIKKLQNGSDALEALFSTHGSKVRRYASDISEVKDSSPVMFLNSNGFAHDSHFADWLLAVWGGWMANHVPTLTELHNTSIRRERRRFSGRLAAGIMGLLVICGIAGTLFCIHPILDQFHVKSTAAGETEAHQRAEQATKMIQALGQTFLPSLTALVFTVCLAISRGWYLQSANELTWKLDRFAVDSLFYKFRPRMFGEELGNVQIEISELIEHMEEREKKALVLLTALGQYTQTLSKLVPGVVQATNSMDKAAQQFGGQAEALRSAIEQQFGEKSAVITSLNSVVASAQTCHGSAQALQAATRELNGTVEAHTKGATVAQLRLEATMASFPREVGAIVTEHTTKSVGETNAALEKTTLVMKGIAVAVDTATQTLGEAGRLAAGRVTDSLKTLPKEVDDACQKASQSLLDAAKKGNQDAIGKISANTREASAQFHTDTQAASKLIAAEIQAGVRQIHAEMDPINTAAAGIKTTNAALQTEVRQGLRKEMEVFRTSSGEVMDGFDKKIGGTAEELVTTQKEISKLVAEAGRIVIQLERINPLTRWWEKIPGASYFKRKKNS